MAPSKKTSTKGKAQKEEEVPEVELEDLDDQVSEETDKKKGKAQEVTFGVADLVKYINAKSDKEYTTRDIRALIRKMAREESPRVNREIVAGNRSRYDWPDGLKDPEVKAIIKAILGGEVEAGKKEALDALKAKKAKEKAEGGGSKKAKGKGKGKAKEAEPDEDEIEIDLDD